MGAPEFGAGAHHVLNLAFGPHAHAGDGLAGRSPLGLVVRHGGEHVGIHHEAITGQAPAQRLDQGADLRHDSVPELITSTAREPPGTSTPATSLSTACVDPMTRP